MTDDERLNAAMSGDRDALVDLLEALAPRIRGRIEAKLTPALRTQIDADDVLQITWIETITHLATFKGGGVSGFLAWLTRMAENNLIDAVRAIEASKRPSPSRRVRDHDQGLALLEQMGATWTTPSRVAARSEANDFLDDALDKLPPAYAEVVRLYDLEQRPIEEVSEALGRTSGAVYMLRARAHDRLRDLLGSTWRFFTVTG
ncbi:MAG: sigma-70 family RNA polymerase sigma factor [Phycisphaerales bacterium]|nr:sigma-70 family RNA polymerase sigma factor [Phycisphaerales bacterium]